MQLRDWLEKESLTQDALGHRMKPSVSQGKVSHWLNGTRRVSLGEALQIVAITGGAVSFGELAAMHRRPRDLGGLAGAVDRLQGARDAA